MAKNFLDKTGIAWVFAKIKSVVDGLATVAKTGSYNDLTDKKVWYGYYNGFDVATSTLNVKTIDSNFTLEHLTRLFVSFNFGNVNFAGYDSIEIDINDGQYTGGLYNASELGAIWEGIELTYMAAYGVFVPSTYLVATATGYGGVKISDDASTNDSDTAWSTVGAKQLIDSLASVATSGAYSDLSGTPTLADVATSGSYNDLTDIPFLATVATSGSYNDLTNTPTIPSAPVSSYAASGVTRPWLNLNSGNDLEVSLWRYGKIVVCRIYCLLQVNVTSSSNLSEYTIPKEYRPSQAQRASYLCWSGTSMIGQGMWLVGTDGGIQIAKNTNTTQYCERHVTMVWETDN